MALKRKESLRDQRVVILLGNLDDEGASTPNDATKLAKKDSDTLYIGVDMSPYQHPKSPQSHILKASAKLRHALLHSQQEYPSFIAEPNHIQFQANFANLLRTLPPEYADEVVSNLAVGHCNKNGEDTGPGILDYTVETLQLAYEKLKPNGRIRMVVVKSVIDIVDEAFSQTPFQKSDITFRQMTQMPEDATSWMREYPPHELYEITANKQILPNIR